MTKVSLVSAGSEDIVAYCARVSNPANQDNENIAGLLRYCMRHGHWSVFEMANAVLEVETTRDIARQLLRHRSFSFQEFSQRYADVRTIAVGDPFVIRETRMQDHKNRQNSIQIDVEDPEQRDLNSMWKAQQMKALRASKEVYDWALSNGIAKEQARAVLPEGMTMSRLYANGTLRSWIHFLKVRLDPSTQKEHRELAEQVYNVLEKVFPITLKALNDDK